MLKRVSTIVLFAAAQYVLAAAALFVALERGVWPAATIGALGAGLVALAAVASLVIGRRLGRREAADEAAPRTQTPPPRAPNARPPRNTRRRPRHPPPSSPASCRS